MIGTMSKREMRKKTSRGENKNGVAKRFEGKTALQLKLVFALE